MSSELDDEFGDDPSGLEDVPIDCYTNFAIVEIPNPDDPTQPAITHDIEIISDRPLSSAELEQAALNQVAPWLGALTASPRFRQRFGTQPPVNIIGAGVIHGC